MSAVTVLDPFEAPADHALLVAAQGGDGAAFRRLVEPHRGALEGFARRILGSDHDAEDIVQETLVRAWGGLPRYEPRAPLRAWLYRIAHRACLTELERRARRPEPAQERVDAELQQTPSRPDLDPAARYAEREHVELALVTTIRELPARQRAVLMLHDVLGWSAPEVAGLLESSPQAVNSALQRARATLRSRPAAETPASVGGGDRELLDRYVDAWARTDVDALIALLHEDAVLRMPPGPALHGREAIAGFFAAVWRSGHDYELVAGGAESPAAAWLCERATLAPVGRIALSVADGRITGLDADTSCGR